MRVLETLSWEEIARAMGAQALGETRGAAFGGSIDTRTLQPGDIFFALRGEHVDGHDYLDRALERGASCAVVKAKVLAPAGLFRLIVPDPESALFELGRLIRAKTSARVVAITGSTGKTTTKEFTAELLRVRGGVLATAGNLNNHLGVPLTLTRLETTHWAAVVECGMSRLGELSRLSHLLRPDVAAVTNVAAAHLESFESIDQIARAKAEIFDGLSGLGAAVAPADDQRLAVPAQRAAHDRRRLFGEGPSTSVWAETLSMTLDGTSLLLNIEGAAAVPARLTTPGSHAVSNFLAAATIALALGLSPAEIAQRAPLLKSPGNRGGLRRLSDDIVLIDDSYNSSPRAVIAAVDTLALATGRRLVACLGDMLELGSQGPELHRSTGAAIASKVDLLLGVGPLGAEMVRAAKALPEGSKKAFTDSTAMAAQIGALVNAHDAILVKGSRGMRMERVVETLVAAHPQVSA